MNSAATDLRTPQNLVRGSAPDHCGIAVGSPLAEASGGFATRRHDRALRDERLLGGAVFRDDAGSEPPRAEFRARVVRAPLRELQLRQSRAALSATVSPPFACGLMWSIVKFVQSSSLRHFSHLLRAAECQISLRCSAVKLR